MLKRTIRALKRRALRRLGQDDPEALKELAETGEVTVDEDTAYFPPATRADFIRQQQEDDGTAAWLDRLKRL